MKPITQTLQTHLQGEVTTLATCWKLVRRDLAILGFTDHDRDLVVAGVTYQAATGFTPTAVASSDQLNVDDLEVEGMLNAATISEADLLAGKYDYAEINVFMVNTNDLAGGTLPLRHGWLGEVTMRQQRFVAEVRGLTQRLSQTVGQIYAPACRAKLGDARCKVNMAARTFTGALTSVTSRTMVGDSTRLEPAGRFTFGKLTFTSGPNSGISIEVKDFAAGSFALALPLPYDAQVGNAYSVQEGCDKTLATCIGRFNNALNFRGEPHVPGLDRMLETAGTRSEWE